MTEVLFYHLTESRLEQALPDLLEKSLARGWRVVVQCSSEERRDALDNHLWTYREDSFLPHGSDRESSGALQPILLTVDPAQRANDPQVRFLVDGAVPRSLADYVRAVYLFDGHDTDQLDTARARWTAEKAAGHAVTYWQQTEEGRWVKKA
ncbi:DNA polymerase III subunit chi [Jiella sp. MQZ9-1]|uniref:DNA polymerase III subunit chi n=1 Tax=Jiella flava TaxID=2816857 RepID=A0A939FXJ4_9HYPH|nr:DNA polymerase III subunit chi [Jiella flava]MBO0661990.1 DNA polymerase III subunit chi [Jiella flava]MCD2470683.1 DNA polymerase III subunit chi [Jiella flava]